MLNFWSNGWLSWDLLDLLHRLWWKLNRRLDNFELLGLWLWCRRRLLLFRLLNFHFWFRSSRLFNSSILWFVVIQPLSPSHCPGNFCSKSNTWPAIILDTLPPWLRSWKIFILSFFNRS